MYQLFSFFSHVQCLVVFTQPVTAALWRSGSFCQAEVRTSCTFGHVKGTHDPADCDSPLIHRVSVHPHNLSEEGLIIP